MEINAASQALERELLRLGIPGPTAKLEAQKFIDFHSGEFINFSQRWIEWRAKMIKQKEGGN